MPKTKKNSQIILDDCLSALKKIKTESVDVVYLDPPFYTQKNHQLVSRDGKNKYSFSDCWPHRTAYLDFLRIRLHECRRVLKKTGSLFFHCDSSASHYIKVMLDDIFGEDQFRSDIVWSYKRWSNSKKGLLSQHQNILFYSKTPDFKFHTLKTEYSPTTNVEQIVQRRTRDIRNKSVYAKNADGTHQLASDKSGVPLGDVWEIPFLNPKARERVSYPTQKPILLLERILQLVTDEGDVVLDPFCGSGTTLVAAQELRRSYIGIDQNPDAVKLAETRLAQPIKTESVLLKKGVLHYLKQSAEVGAMIKKIGAVPVLRNKGIDGLLHVQNQIMPVKVVFHKSELLQAAEKIKKAVQKNKFKNCGICCSFKVNRILQNEFYEKNSILLFNSQADLLKQL